MNAPRDPQLAVASNDGVVTVSLNGDWLLHAHPPERTPVLQALADAPAPTTVRYDCAGLGKWDTALLTLLADVQRATTELSIDHDTGALPDGARELLQLAFAVQEREGARRELRQPGFVESAGTALLDIRRELLELLQFTGNLLLSIRRLLQRRATLQSSQVWLAIQEAGAEALPIVGLISFLIGMIFAFVGVVQLTDFGAGIYTADLVAVALVREMAPIMTGIIMAGRTGAAYAAQIGTMKVNEEIDALTTLGINPIDFLVLPRFFALIIVMPFLTMYASMLGIIGGTVVALSMLDVSLVQYVVQTNDSIGMNTLFGGLFKSIVYGAMVALTGTQQGIACGSSAMAVGQATTRAVVMGIVLIVVSAAVLTVIYINLDI